MSRESSRTAPVVLGFLQRRLVHRLQLRLGLSRAESRPVETLVSLSKQAVGGSAAAARVTNSRSLGLVPAPRTLTRRQRHALLLVGLDLRLAHAL